MSPASRAALRLYLFARRVQGAVWRRLPVRGSFAESRPRPIPRRVFLYWDAGEAAAPELVRACIASWRALNPGWRVDVLDRESEGRFAAMPDLPEGLSVQHRTDLLRLRLLTAHGGVWADATCLCRAPLDTWLPMVASSGFFAFAWKSEERWLSPAVRRPIANWFLASEPGGTVIAAWEAAASDYLAGLDGPPRRYFWPVELFAWLTLTDRRVRRAWGSVPRLGVLGPHLVRDHIVNARPRAETLAALAAAGAPVQKLDWRMGEHWPAIEGLLAEAGREAEPPRTGAR